MTISPEYIAVPFASGVVGSLPRPLMVQDMLPDVPGIDSISSAMANGAGTPTPT